MKANNSGPRRIASPVHETPTDSTPPTSMHRLKACIAGGQPIGRAWLRVRALGRATIWLRALAPARGVCMDSGRRYGPRERHRLDVYVPRQRGATAPVVVFFYGGSWQNGDRRDYRFLGQTLAARGLLTIVADYRVYPPTRFPEFVDDAARAVAFARAHAIDYGGDPARVFVAGHSAGAHIAALVASDPRYLAAFGVDASRLAGVIGLAGAYDFLPIRDPVLQTIFGAAGDGPASQPVNFVTPDTPPMLLVHGRADSTVEPGNTTRLRDAIIRAGGRVEAHIIPGATHALLLARLVRPWCWFYSTASLIDAFIAAHHGPEIPPAGARQPQTPSA